MKLKSKTAVVTGGSDGLGLEIVRKFVTEGAHVFIIARRQEQLEKVAAEFPHSVTTFRGDVTNLGVLDEFYDLVRSCNRGLDVLVVNAGATELASLDEITPEHFDSLISLNVRSALFTVQKALPLFNNPASIILIGSMVSAMGVPGFTVYSSTKAALRSFARTWTTEFGGRGIRTNVLSPGPTITPRFANAPREITDPVVTMVPLRRGAQMSEIANAALFLASEDSSYVVGTELFADGGGAQI